jgi:predicted ATP-grasp superfamily ATP-dependent carboligase
MTPRETLHLDQTPDLTKGAMLLGFSGWMDGAEVSTGALSYIASTLSAQPIGRIQSDDFYILNVPGSMEIAALFRPPAKIEAGLIQSLHMPTNEFHAAEPARLLIFRGKEPNLGWERYADALLDAATRCNIQDLYFVGSVGTVLPHTREPVFWSTMTSEWLREKLATYGITPTNYEGPASFATYLSQRAADARLNMATLVAGIPSYIEGRNPRCIEAMVAKLNEILELNLDLAPLTAQRKQFMQGVQLAMTKNQKLAERIKQLEQMYDKETRDNEEEETDDDIRDWFERQNIKLD